MTLAAPSVAADALLDAPGARPVRSSRRVYGNHLWSVRSDEVDLGDGGTRVRDYVRHPGSVSVVALREDRGEPQIALVHQYRHPVATTLWELPAGLLDEPGEAPVDAARRELAEEADLRGDRWHLLTQFHPSPGCLDETQRVFLARDLSDVPVAERHERHAEEADMTLGWARLADVVDAVLTARVANPILVVGALALHTALTRDGGTTLLPADAAWPPRPDAATD